MIHLSISFFIAVAIGPGEIQAPEVPTGSEIYVSSKECTVRLVGQRISGEPGCDIKVAIVDSNGLINRHTVRLPHESDEDDDAEDRPGSATETLPTQAPATRTTVSPKEAMSRDLSPFFGLGFGRDISAFGLADVGVYAGLQYGDALRFQVSWRGGLARTQTDLLDIERKIELSSDLVMAKIGYLQILRPNLNVCADMGFGSGRLKSDTVSDDRNRLSTSTQTFILYRPSLGLEWTTGQVRLGLGWQWTFAEGNWFPADEFGTPDSNIPPENSGLMTQGLELNLGMQL